MAGLDPEEDDTAAPSTTPTDASKTPVHDAWQSWTSNPANNAALLQFGIAMLQPRSPGQSGIGAAANALAEGGGAAGRVIAGQDAEALAEQNKTSKETEDAAKTSNAASAASTAAAYGRSVDNAGSLTSGKGALQAAIRGQAAYQRWSAKPEDPLTAALGTGSNDPIVQALQKTHPDIKTKADVISNPIYAKEAKQLLGAAAAASPATDDSGDDGTATGTPSPAAVAAPATPQTKVGYDKNGKAVTFNLVNGQWIPQQQ